MGKEKYYKDTLLVESECECLRELESLLGEPIPRAEPLPNPRSWENFASKLKFGFIAKNNQVLALDLHDKHLTKLPDSIGDLKQLEILHAYDTKLEQIPSIIGNLSRLTVLNLNSNRLKALPKEIGNLQSL